MRYGAILLTPLAALVLASPAQSRSIQQLVALGEHAALADGVTVEPLMVLEDNRCPVVVDCFHAGQLFLAVAVRIDGNDHRITLSLQSPQRVGDGTLTLTRATPNRTGKPIAPQDYRFGFSFVRDEKSDDTVNPY